MSIILDALRRGRGRQTTKPASSAAQTDAVLKTLGYSRVNQVSRRTRLTRIAAAVAGGVFTGVLLWTGVVWATRAYLQRTEYNVGDAARAEQRQDVAVEPVKHSEAAAPFLTRSSLTSGGGAATPEAIRHFQRAISINPQDAHARNNLGIAYLAQGKLDEAAAQLHAAQASDPENLESLVNLSAVEKESGHRDEARRWATRALQIDAHNAEAHYNLAVLEDDAGQTEQARTHYLAFVQYGAEAYPSLAIEVRRRIDILAGK